MSESAAKIKISIAIPLQLTDDQRSRLVKLGAQYIATERIDPSNGQPELAKRIEGAQIAVIGPTVPIDRKFLISHPQLRLIQTASIGMDHIDVKAADELKIAVKHSGDYCTEAIAERTFTMMLALCNQVISSNNLLKQGTWDSTRFRGRELSGRTLVLLGHGKIGKRVEELARVFGMKVICLNSKSTKSDFHKALASADFVSLHCPYTPQTHEVMNAEAFHHLKKDAILINTARGKLIDENALLAALENKTLAFVGMDVFAKQPPAPDNPLVAHERVLATPYCAWYTDESVPRRNETIIRNVQEFCTLAKA